VRSTEQECIPRRVRRDHPGPCRRRRQRASLNPTGRTDPFDPRIDLPRKTTRRELRRRDAGVPPEPTRVLEELLRSSVLMVLTSAASELVGCLCCGYDGGTNSYVVRQNRSRSIGRASARGDVSRQHDRLGRNARCAGRDGGTEPRTMAVFGARRPRTHSLKTLLVVVTAPQRSPRHAIHQIPTSRHRGRLGAAGCLQEPCAEGVCPPTQRVSAPSHHSESSLTLDRMATAEPTCPRHRSRKKAPR